MSVVTKNRSIPKLANFDDFFARNIFNKVYQKNESDAVPNINIIETDKFFTVKMSAPGLKKEDFQVKVWHDTLTIQMVTKVEHNYQEEFNYVPGKIDYQSFKRTVFLPDIADGGKINASYLNGELKIEIPKKSALKSSGAKNISIS